MSGKSGKSGKGGKAGTGQRTARPHGGPRPPGEDSS